MRENLFDLPCLLERNVVEEAKGCNSHAYRLRCQLLFICQIDQIGSDVFWAEQFRRLTEVTGEQRDLLDVRGSSVRRPVPYLEILDHPFPKTCHGQLLCEVEGCCKQPLHDLAVGATQTRWKEASRYRQKAMGGAARNLPRSGLVVCWACSAAWRWKSSAQPDGGEGL